MELKQLESFASVVQCGSFTKAAEQLYLSQPSISTHIQMLEKELKTRLIRRTTKTIALTPEGQRVYEYALKMLELRDRMLRECTAEPQRILHLGASTIPASYILPELLPAFSRREPNTFFVLHQHDSNGVVNGVAEGLYDVGLAAAAPSRADLRCECFYRDRMILITPVTEHFLKLQSQPEVPLELLMQEPVILREQAPQGRKWADAFLEQMQIDQNQLNVAARVNNPEVIKSLVAEGLGISFLSERAARNLLIEKRLLKFELPSYRNTRELYLITRQESSPRPWVRSFSDFVRSYYL